MIISSRQNPLFKEVLALKDKKRERLNQQKILVQGTHALTNIISEADPLLSLFHGETLKPEEVSLLHQYKARGVPLVPLTDKLMKELIYGDMPENLTGIATYPRRNLSDLQSSADGIFIVLDAIEKPGNIGAILRTADATGVSAVIACDMQTDPYHPNVIRSSMGCALTMPYFQTDHTTLFEWINREGLTGFTLSPQAKHSFWDMTYPRPLFMVVGNESDGLSGPWQNNRDVVPVSIPMRGCADSLNASVSLTVVLFEIIRQGR